MQGIKPGDLIKRSDPESTIVRTVVALLQPGMILCHDGRIFDHRFVEKVDGSAETVRVAPEVYKILLDFNMIGPDLSTLNVGDGLLLIDGMEHTITVIAVIDWKRKLVYTKDGQIVKLKNPNVALSGWHTNEQKLLTNLGLAVLCCLY